MSSPSISALTAGISFSACTQAFTKKLMKPSFTPCFFSKTSLYWLRSAMVAVMSTSLKVVSIAAMFCASFRRRAIVWRRRDIDTRSSRAASDGADGALAAGAGAAGMTRGLMSAAGFSSAAMTSPLVMRPSLPVPAMAAASTLFSVTILRTAGDKALLGLGRRRRRIGLRAGASAGFAAAPPAAPSSIDPRSAPTLTVLPAAASIARELARRRRRHFHRDLVGLQFHQRLVGLHRFTGLLEPLGDRRFGDRFAESRNADFLRHLVCPLCLAVAEGIIEECLQFLEMPAHRVPLRWQPMRPGRHSGRARSWRR